MEGVIPEELQKDGENTSNLPYDILENILSRIPVKSLLRFKTVCKPWKAIISDPRFAATHLQQSKNSASQKVLVWNLQTNRETYVLKSENNKFQIESAIDYPINTYCSYGRLCYCDGLILKMHSEFNNLYVLWSPSSRIYKTFRCPYPKLNRDYFESADFGLYYDPSLKDYKVVITDMKHYAVFHCRNEYWSEMTEVNKEFSWTETVLASKWVSIDGAFYWVVTIIKNDRLCLEIICFDSRVEKFKKLAMPDSTQNFDLFDVACLGGHLCLFWRRDSNGEVSMFKRVGNGNDDSYWTEELKVQLPFSWPTVICLMNENEILLGSGDSEAFIVYNQSKKSFDEIQKIPSRTRKYSFPVPYMENLLFSSPNN